MTAAAVVIVDVTTTTTTAAAAGVGVTLVRKLASERLVGVSLCAFATSLVLLLGGELARKLHVASNQRRRLALQRDRRRVRLRRQSLPLVAPLLECQIAKLVAGRQWRQRSIQATA